MAEVLTQEITKTTSTDTGDHARVILFNDDWHTMNEVIAQLIKAINCSYAVAEKMALTAHHQGKCSVFAGPLMECLEVSSVLEEIDLKTSIEYP